MHIFEFVVIVVALSVFGSMFNSWLKQKEKYSNADTSEREARVNALEKRVQVLERIVTDKAEKLKDDINNL